MYKYRLKERTYTPGGFKVGDVETLKGRKSTVTDVDPKTGGVTWSIEDIAAFDTVYKHQYQSPIALHAGILQQDHI